MWDWLPTPCEYRYRTLVANTLCNVVRTVNKAFRCCHCWCCCYCCCFCYLVCFICEGKILFQVRVSLSKKKKDVSWTNRHNRNEAKLNFLHLQLNNSPFFFVYLKAIAKLTASYLKKHLPAMHKTHTGLSDAQAEIEYLKVSRPVNNLFVSVCNSHGWDVP